MTTLGNNGITYRIAQLQDVESVYNFELAETSVQGVDEYEKMMSVWSSSFRKESLEHYFKLGWSFIASDAKLKIVGFFLGQPLLFFAQQTQTLWIEHVSAIDSSVTTELVDVAYRLAREKHFQRVLCSDKICKLKLDKKCKGGILWKVKIKKKEAIHGEGIYPIFLLW